MFTKPTNTPVAGFTEGLANKDNGSLLRAAWLNYVSNNFPSILDAVGGGYYQLAGADLRLSSDTRKFKINSAAVGQPTSLLGFVRIGVTDDANYAVGVGDLIVSSPATFSAATVFSAGVTYSGAITYSNTVQFNGVVTLNAAMTCTTNGDITLQSGCTVTGQSGAALTMEDGSTTTLDVVNVNDTMTVATGKNIVLNGTSAITFDSPRSPRRPCTLVWVDTAYWGPSVGLPLAWPHQVEQTVATNPANATTNLRYECEIPPGASVVTVQVWIDPAAGHGAVPANLPQLIVWIYDSDAGTAPQTGAAAVADNSSVPNYEARQLLTVTAGVNTIAVPQKVICQVYGEGGANFVAGMIVDEPTFTFSTPGMDMT